MTDNVEMEISHQKNKVWFDRPAIHFAESTPLGNGRLGAMVYGGVAQEKIVLNECSVWSGSPEDSDRDDAYKHLPEIRKMLMAGRNKEAQDLFIANFTCKGKGSGYARGSSVPFGCYQVLGNLHLSFFQYTSHGRQDEGIYGYRRELDLSSAVMSVQFETGGVKYIRECFASAAAQAIVLRIRADRPGSVTFSARLDRLECYSIATCGVDGLLMKGRLDDGRGGKGTEYACRVKVVCSGGSVVVEGSTIHVREADDARVYITAATDAKAFAGRNCDDAPTAAQVDMDKVSEHTWEALLLEHTAEYQRYYDRVCLELGRFNAGKHEMTTMARIQAIQNGEVDSELDALYFNFGRYLLISSSRPGGLPANIQGIWAEEIQTPWNGDWHLNAQQMVYWPAEVCNLSELHDPYLKLTESLQKAGAKTAKLYYDARGWVAHTFTNLWGFTSPGEDAAWGSTTGSSAWLCQHLWDHYQFTMDSGYLKWAYPVMKGAAQFYLDMLIKEPVNNWLVTAPSESPENAFYTAEGDICHLCIGSTYDMQLLRYLFSACIEASSILGIDQEFRNELGEKRKMLVPTRLKSDGRIMEWIEEYREALPYHRHISNLWGLFPGDEITVDKTPQLAEAAKKTLLKRGEVSPGWAIAYRQCAWARLQDGNKAYECFQKILKGATFPNLLGRCYHASETEQPPTMPPLTDYDHPFQIDGNLGATAGVAEMLLQSRMEWDSDATLQEQMPIVCILPALPASWPEGSIKGLCARGGFVVDIYWKDSKLTKVVLRSTGGEKCKVKYGSKTVDVCLNADECIMLDENLK